MIGRKLSDSKNLSEESNMSENSMQDMREDNNLKSPRLVFEMGKLIELIHDLQNKLKKYGQNMQHHSTIQ